MESTFRENAATTTREVPRAFAEGEMTKDEALLMCLEYIEKNAHERKYVRHAIKAAHGIKG